MEVSEEAFQKAINFVRSKPNTFDSSALLYLYARYKQVTEGPCNTPKPGWFDFQAKAKWEAWKSLGRAKKEDCMTEYVGKVLEVHPDFASQARDTRYDHGKQSSGMGVAVSCMTYSDDELDDEDKTIFDWLKDDDITEVTKMLKSHSIDAKDEEGLTLLHWACDRGLVEMVDLLLQHGANINVKDSEGLTPLHYAVSCEYVDVVQLLLHKGADPSVVDDDGKSPSQGTQDKTILELFKT